MGLFVAIDGIDTIEDGFVSDYENYHCFIGEVVKSACGEAFGNKYMDTTNPRESASTEEISALMKEWGKKASKTLELLCLHSDCDGEFSAKECKRISTALKKVTSEKTCKNYLSDKEYNLVDRWKSMFDFCAKNNKTMFFC